MDPAAATGDGAAVLAATGSFAGALALLRACFAAGAGVVLPGLLILRAAGLARGGRLERVVVAGAAGRIALAAAAFLAGELGALAALPGLALLLCGVAGILVWRGRRSRAPGPRPSRAATVSVAVVVTLALAVVFAVLGHSALPREDGALVFYGVHGTNDTVFYAGIVQRLAAAGLPLDNPFAADWPQRSHYVFFGSLLGLQALLGGDVLEAAFRVRPVLDVVLLGLAALVLARRLGASWLGATLGAAVLLLGTGVEEAAVALLQALGRPVIHLEAWAFGGPYLLPVNPVAPGLHAIFAACLLLLRLPPDAASGATRRALAAGLLLASVMETKIFLWPPIACGIVAAAWWLPARAMARPLRVAAVAALVATVPSWIEKLSLGAELAHRATVQFAPCPGCLPRFMAGSLLAPERVGLYVFEAFEPAQLLSPVWWLVTLGAAALFLVILIGARLAVLWPLWRGVQADSGPAARVAVTRMLAIAALAGAGAACLMAPAPHYFDAAQFAWLATHGLMPVLAVPLGTWLRGRSAPFALALLLGVSLGTPRWLIERGALAPATQRIEAPERALLAAFAAEAPPGTLVLEPSLRTTRSQLSPLPLLTGRPVFLSKQGVGETLVPEIRGYRERVIDTVFAGRDREAAMAAIRASEAAYVYAPAVAPLRFSPDARLEPRHSNAAGTLYRVRSD